MESLQGPINPNTSFYSESSFTDLGFDELEEACFLTSSLEDKMPFLQMLQSVETQPLNFKEPGFQTLLRLQHLNKPWEEEEEDDDDDEQQQQQQQQISQIKELVELYSTETKEQSQQQPNSASGLSSECNQNQPNYHSGSAHNSRRTQMAKAPPTVTRERRKRKRTRPAKNKDEMESQRMTHIAVERNRRRQMNDHLSVIKSLIPTSYIQRGDQASIIGGAIDFVKELEQLLESLETQRKERKGDKDDEAEAENGGGGDVEPPHLVGSPTSSAMAMALAMETSNGIVMERRIGEGVCAEHKSEVAEIEVTLIQTHVNLKIKCPKRQGQLLKAIVALEDLSLTVLHLNVTTSQATATMLYSFNLKIEDECKLGSADQIAATVHQIFSFINDS